MNILKGEDLEDPLFPFICKIDNPEEIDNPDLWEKRIQCLVSQEVLMLNHYLKGINSI